ncbi:MAG: 3-deoxy-8-phosphooctulonate synthase [Phycisphaerae bacterium]|jgi:2-dehydro-3-deoxyphosphooctonate aldolase (KDO 8-P synthase)|nr:3-deoxy-8-phosphooctulonate synthase [Phycisphaerae bacterium]
MTDNNDSACSIGSVSFGSGRLAVIAGPCMAESLQLCLEVASEMAQICRQLDIGYVFKASFDKANRTSSSSYRGPGLETAGPWFEQVAREIDVPIVTDIHDPSQAAPAAQVADCLQIPAFLCRQTDLLLAAADTGKTVNIKKGQFMAPWDMGQAVDKVRAAGNDNVLLTERGTTFGYNRLVTDFRGIPQMRRFAPVVFDATHSVQEPGGLGNASGGKREYAPLLAGAAMAAGADALFIETHTDPDSAKSDAASQVPLDEMSNLLRKCLAIYEIARKT